MKRIKTMLIITSLAVVLTACSKNEEVTESSIEETEKIVDTVEEETEKIVDTVEEETEKIVDTVEEETEQTTEVDNTEQIIEDTVYDEETLREMLDPDVHVTYGEKMLQSMFDETMSEAVAYITETEYTDLIDKKGEENAVYTVEDYIKELAWFYKEGRISKEDYYKAAMSSEYRSELSSSINDGSYVNPDTQVEEQTEDTESTQPSNNKDNGTNDINSSGNQNGNDNQTSTSDVEVNINDPTAGGSFDLSNVYEQMGLGEYEPAPVDAEHMDTTGITIGN